MVRNAHPTKNAMARGPIRAGQFRLYRDALTACRAGGVVREGICWVSAPGKALDPAYKLHKGQPGPHAVRPPKKRPPALFTKSVLT